MQEYFRYYMPTEMYFGQNVVINSKDIFGEFGKKAYVITYRMSPGVKHQSLEDVIKIFNQLNIDYYVETEIEPNPSTETIKIVAEKAKNANVDFLVAIGGGSPIDAAKAIGVLVKNPDKSCEDLFADESLKSIPIIAIPTTAGTGAEVTHWSVLTRNDIGTKQAIKPKIFPVVALADPTYLMGMPNSLTFATALDALSHCIESYVSTAGNVLSRAICEIGFRTFSETVDAMRKGEFNYEIREKQMLISIIGGFANTQTGTSLPHGMSYALTHHKNIPHGLACGLLIKNYMDIFKDKTKIERIINLCGFSSLDEFGDFINSLLELKIEVTEDEIEEYANEFASQKHRFIRHPEPAGLTEVKQIYINSLLKKQNKIV
jgi:alcohol dehydrogenase